MTAAGPDSGRAHAVYPVVRLFAALALMTIGGSGMYAAIMVLKPAAAEFDISRAASSLPYTLQMLGFGLGGVAMGWASDRWGVMRPTLLASLTLPAGFVLASRADGIWELALAHGLLIGAVGASATMAPLVADISHWFDRRRGIAVAIVISGSYTAGAIWPPVFQHFFDLYGWRETYFGHAIFCLVAMALLSLVFYRRPEVAEVSSDDHAGSGWRKPLGMTPGLLQVILCAAGIGCCVAMAMPQVHITAYVTDLGYAAQHGANMLGLMLACGIVSRLGSGWISDRIGGLKTLLLGSSLQCVMLLAFLPTSGLTMLYVVSALFGLSQGGIVPSYTIIIRRYFPPRGAGWRIATVLLFTMIGMALGGWMSAALYDLTGNYRAAFINAVAFNLVHMTLAYILLRRRRLERPILATA